MYLLSLALLSFLFAPLGAAEESPPPYLYKILSVEDWQKSRGNNKIIHLSEMDEEFIHLATEEQLEKIREKFWSGKDHVVLKLKTADLIGRLVYETNPGGSTFYYHLYEGAIPLQAVQAVSFVIH